MHRSVVSFAHTRRFSPIVLDYLDRSPALKPFYTWPTDLNMFGEIMQQKQREQIDRTMLVEVLQQQYAGVTATAATAQHIRDFNDANTFCIVTAHQLNIFTGPLYVVYKTLSAIRLCRDLAVQYPDKTFVPVFWLGSEDHDFKEINHAQVFGKTFTWNDEQGGGCGRYRTDSIQPLAEELVATFGNSPFADDLKQKIASAYAPGQSLAHATRLLLNALFGDHGLVVIDGDDVRLKGACASIITDELTSQRASSVVQETLKTFPFEAQAHTREINLFYLEQNIRERIVYDAGNNAYTVNHTDLRFSASEMFEMVESHPERFSPNVILRPLFQQKVLPSLAYIGGGGEVAYWLQLKDLFAYYAVQFPMVLLRDSFMLIDTATDKKILKLGLAVDELFADEHIVVESYVRKHADAALDLAGERSAIEALFNAINEKAKQIDTSLEQTVMAERQSVFNTLQKLEGKLLKAEKAKMDVQVKQVTGVLQKLFPGGGLQERSDNFIPWYLKYGPHFFDQLLENTQQPVTGFTVLRFAD